MEASLSQRVSSQIEMSSNARSNHYEEGCGGAEASVCMSRRSILQSMQHRMHAREGSAKGLKTSPKPNSSPAALTVHSCDDGYHTGYVCRCSQKSTMAQSDDRVVFSEKNQTHSLSPKMGIGETLVKLAKYREVDITHGQTFIGQISDQDESKARHSVVHFCCHCHPCSCASSRRSCSKGEAKKPKKKLKKKVKTGEVKSNQQEEETTRSEANNYVFEPRIGRPLSKAQEVLDSIIAQKTLRRLEEEKAALTELLARAEASRTNSTEIKDGKSAHSPIFLLQCCGGKSPTFLENTRTEAKSNLDTFPTRLSPKAPPVVSPEEVPPQPASKPLTPFPNVRASPPSPRCVDVALSPIKFKLPGNHETAPTDLAPESLDLSGAMKKRLLLDRANECVFSLGQEVVDHHKQLHRTAHELAEEEAANEKLRHDRNVLVELNEKLIQDNARLRAIHWDYIADSQLYSENMHDWSRNAEKKWGNFTTSSSTSSTTSTSCTNNSTSFQRSKPGQQQEVVLQTLDIDNFPPEVRAVYIAARAPKTATSKEMAPPIQAEPLQQKSEPVVNSPSPPPPAISTGVMDAAQVSVMQHLVMAHDVAQKQTQGIDKAKLPISAETKQTHFNPALGTLEPAISTTVTTSSIPKTEPLDAPAPHAPVPQIDTTRPHMDCFNSLGAHVSKDCDLRNGCTSETSIQGIATRMQNLERYIDYLRHQAETGVTRLSEPLRDLNPEARAPTSTLSPLNTLRDSHYIFVPSVPYPHTAAKGGLEFRNPSMELDHAPQVPSSNQAYRIEQIARLKDELAVEGERIALEARRWRAFLQRNSTEKSESMLK